MTNDNYLPGWLDRSEFERAERECHRLVLVRRLGEGPNALLAMCNPSIADDRNDDRTIESVKRIFTHNGFGGVEVVNLFTKRMTESSQLDCGDAASNDSQADNVLRRAFREHETVVFAWGAGSKVKNKSAYRKRAEAVERMALDAGREPLCLGVTKGGFPRHPLYLVATTPLIPLREARERR